MIPANSNNTGAETYSSAISEAVNYSRWILNAFRDLIHGKILEVGIGHASYADLLPENSYVGLDIDAQSVIEARARYPRRTFLQADVLDPEIGDKLPGYRFDTILCLNVLEHLPEGRVALQNLLGLLRPGGHLLVFVPAFETLYSDLDEMAGHYRRYTRSSLSALISPEMGVIVRNEYFNPIGGIGWLANKYLPHKSLNDGAVNAQIRLFDRYILPLSRAISPMTRKIFGQSLVFAVRKL